MGNVVLLEEEKRALADLYRKKISEFTDMIQTLQEEINKLEARLKELGVTDLFTQINDNEILLKEPYSSSWTVSKKAARILQERDKLLTIKELAEEIDILEGGHFTNYRKKDLNDRLAATLKQKVDKDETFIRINYAGSYYYGLKSWVGENGKLNKKYSK